MMEIYICYLIVDMDDIPYVGMTTMCRYRSRMSSHRRNRHKRFKLPITSQILYCSKEHEHICDMEEHFIDSYDSFVNGHNRTPDGKGITDVHGNFTTRGMKYTEESRKRLSVARRLGMEDGSANFRLNEPEIRAKALESKRNRTEPIEQHGRLGKDGMIALRKFYMSRPSLGSNVAFHGDIDTPYASHRAAIYAELSDMYGIHVNTVGEICRNIQTYRWNHPNAQLTEKDVKYISERLENGVASDGYVVNEDVVYYKDYLNAFAGVYAKEYGYQPKGFKLTVRRALTDERYNED